MTDTHTAGESDGGRSDADFRDFRERRAWFDAHFERFNVGIRRAPEYGVRFTCPCCGYPTLFGRGGYDICELCDWEDDAQDEPHAREVWGGPNKDYSLAKARENFERFLVMYGPERDPRGSGPDSEAQRAAKAEVVRAFQAVIAASLPDAPQDERLWRAVDAGLEALRRAPRRRFGEPRR
jgi:hypothetical protein